MIIGATLIGGAILLHHFYKKITSTIRNWIKSNSSWFSKPEVLRAFVVFVQLISGAIRYGVLIKTPKGLEIIDEKVINEKEIPEEERKLLAKQREVKTKKTGLFGFGPSVQTEDVFVAHELEHTW
jgi:hypothetical protein